MEGVSPGRYSVESAAKKSSISPGGMTDERKEFLRRFVDREKLKENLANWFEDITSKTAFDVPFELIDLQKFDYALEGVQFQQLFRMPSVIYASSASSTMEETAYPALEDFLHTSVNSLWEAFWGHESDLIPFYVSSLYDGNLKFYPAEETISKGKLSGVSASAIMLKNPRHPQGKWDDVVELALLRRDIGSYALKNDSEPPFSAVAEALFFALRVLVARSISRSNIPLSLNSVHILIVDSEYGSVVKVEGDINKLDFDQNNIYGSAATWFKENSSISISPVDRIWNKLGNANWGDIGALQVLYSTFHSITQYAGNPNNTVEDLAADHSSRLHTRRLERQSGDDSWSNRNGQFRLQHRNGSTEIVEVQEEDTVQVEKPSKLEAGNVLLLEDSSSRKSYKINEVLDDGETPFYVASSVEDPGTPFYLYIGSHPSQIEPAWEDMKLWYQVQRQTKVLNIIQQKGISSKHLPQLIASGRVIHQGPCRRQSPGGNCMHPWCGTPVLLTSPVGRTVADLARTGHFGPDEALRCCHDCLSALSVSASAGVRHGDVGPENLIRMKSGLGNPHYVLISWGHAILEERDRPALSLHFSSTSALQEGKLCPASDAESLVYLIYFSFGGDLPVLDSVEGALQWRETAWSRRLIQQRLGDISAVLKAFADYVDSLCGTPYPVDYEIWLRRLRRHIHDGEESGKEVNASTA